MTYRIYLWELTMAGASCTDLVEMPGVQCISSTCKCQIQVDTVNATIICSTCIIRHWLCSVDCAENVCFLPYLTVTMLLHHQVKGYIAHLLIRSCDHYLISCFGPFVSDNRNRTRSADSDKPLVCVVFGPVGVAALSLSAYATALTCLIER